MTQLIDTRDSWSKTPCPRDDAPLLGKQQNNPSNHDW